MQSSISESRESTAQYLFHNKINYPVTARTEKCLTVAKQVFLLILEWLYTKIFLQLLHAFSYIYGSHTQWETDDLWSTSSYYTEVTIYIPINSIFKVRYLPGIPNRKTKPRNLTSNWTTLCYFSHFPFAPLYPMTHLPR